MKRFLGFIMSEMKLEDFDLVEIKTIEHNTIEPTRFIDLTLEQHHTFYVTNGSEKFLAHNCDGQHIFGLLTAMIKKFWPELLEMGVFYKFVTPILKVNIGKHKKLFYTLPEFKKWEEENKDKKYSVRYLKGLGSSTASDFKEYFDNIEKHLVQVKVEDASDLEIIDLVFGKDEGSEDKRKEWLQLEDKV
jgi:hypothetical protein